MSDYISHCTMIDTSLKLRAKEERKSENGHEKRERRNRDLYHPIVVEPREGFVFVIWRRHRLYLPHHRRLSDRREANFSIVFTNWKQLPVKGERGRKREREKERDPRRNFGRELIKTSKYRGSFKRHWRKTLHCLSSSQPNSKVLIGGEYDSGAAGTIEFAICI